MVEQFQEARSRAPAVASLAVVLGVASGLSGCGLVPRSKLDDCHRVTQTLRADNNRLKDVALDLRSQNQDLSQRAVDDARRLATQEEAVERLERSVSAYQAERDKMAAAFEAVKRQVRMAVSPHPAARPARLKAIAESHPGWSFDEKSMTLSAPAAALFEPGADALTPAAAEAIKALAAELTGSGSDALALEVVGQADAPPVVRAGFEDDSKGLAAASGRFLRAARAARVRERLVAESGLDPAQARLVPPPPAGPDDAAGRRVEIRVTAGAAAHPAREPRGAEPGRAGGAPAPAGRPEPDPAPDLDSAAGAHP